MMYQIYGVRKQFQQQDAQRLENVGKATTDDGSSIQLSSGFKEEPEIASFRDVKTQE